MPKLTVVTPTYNRADLIENLFISLKRQTVFDFEWLVVDDGSTDNTREKIYEFKAVSPFPINYLFKENGGKHTALNLGIPCVKTDLIIIADSDDTLLPNAVESIVSDYKKIENDDSVGFISYLKCDKSGNTIISLDKDEFTASYVEYRIKGDRPGDMAEVFKTNVLKKYPFPEFKNEKFLSEDVVWIKLGLDYNCLFINKPIYACEYLAGGLTSNDKKSKFASPLGSMLRGKMLMSRECGLKQNIKGAVIYNCYKSEADCEIPPELALNSPKNKILVFLTVFAGKYFNRKWKSGLEDIK
ncbi:MAG: glycosyltransferase family 2 protein [Clostridiales bacterium]|nr:glycosyltransferase family 2 protein [Clostridiales bacterium]